MKSKNKIILMTIGLITILLMVVGMTYSWFNVIIKPEDEASTNVVVKAANLGTITFYNGEEISMDGVYPGWCETKKVSVVSENSTVLKKYYIYLNVETNELKELGSDYGYVTVKSTVVTDETIVTSGSTGTADLQNITYYSGKLLILSGEIGANDKHTYNIEFCFPELGIDQNKQQGKVFKGYLSVEASSSAFSTDSWETIASNVKNGTIGEYNVGDTREITLEGYGTHTLIIANTSTPEECNTEGFSQSACGFVLEFTDIIAKYNMNNTDTNKGSWPASDMYKFINGTDDTTYNAYTASEDTTSIVKSVYMSLPEDLRNIIIDTTVVSGHGKTDTTNFTSTDKLYLLDAKEIYGASFTGNQKDIADYERQLDYHSNHDVTALDDLSLPDYKDSKQYNGSDFLWWLRSVHSGNDNDFFFVMSGVGAYDSASSTYGVSPAFRIG